MSLFRKGVKVGNMDIRTGLSKQRGQGILRKLGVLPDDKGRKKFEQDAMGEVQTIRTIVAKSEGFTMPVNFKVEFQAPKGIDQNVWLENLDTQECLDPLGSSERPVGKNRIQELARLLAVRI